MSGGLYYHTSLFSAQRHHPTAGPGTVERGVALLPAVLSFLAACSARHSYTVGLTPFNFPEIDPKKHPT